MGAVEELCCDWDDPLGTAGVPAVIVGTRPEGVGGWGREGGCETIC